MSHHHLEQHQSLFLFYTPAKTPKHTVKIRWTREEATSLLDKRKCEHPKTWICLCLHRNRTIFKKNCSPCYSKKPCANAADSLAYWFQGTQLISQHYNQAKSLPVGWLQEGHNDSHRTASWEVKKNAALKFPLQYRLKMCSARWKQARDGTWNAQFRNVLTFNSKSRTIWMENKLYYIKIKSLHK